ncbi:MAG: hypothetical protein AMXMBFR53_42070 [Gemmatimonadota bacterium]
MTRGAAVRRLGLVSVALLALPGAGGAQARPELRVRAGDSEETVPLATARGYAAFPVARLALLGWEVERTGMGALLAGPGGARVEVRDGTPVLRWDDTLLQLFDVPYFEGGELYAPLQLATDLLPWRLPALYRFDGRASLLAYEGRAPAAVVPPDSAAPEGRAEEEEPRPPVTDTSTAAAAAAPPPATDAATPPPAALAGRRVVIIDAGHGGEDPGTIARSGLREKNVALGIATAMADALRRMDEVDVVMIRSGDTFVPPWDRGALATDLKGERYGLFVSIHANSAPSRTSTARGFETYFLSEARTEHERRVAAIENAPLGVEAPAEETAGDLGFILRELKNLDQQHWSSLLAEMVQGELARIHPGPNRGVKQGPLAVLTNAIMPSVLVEIGYLSHPDEARLLGEAGFQKDAGEALALAVGRFLQRYPPGAS